MYVPITDMVISLYILLKNMSKWIAGFDFVDGTL